MPDKDLSKDQMLEQIKNLALNLDECESERFTSSSKDKTIQSILNAVPHAIVGLLDRKIVFCNSAVENVFQYSREEIIGQSTRIFYRNDQEYEQIGKDFYPRLANQNYYAEEFICRTKEGKDIVCIVSAARFGTSLEQNKIVVMYEDITQRKKTEKAQELFRNLMQQSRDAIFIIDPETARIIDANDQATINLGFTHQELLSKTAIDIQEVFDENLWKIHIEKLKNFKEMLKEGVHIGKDGRRMPVEVSIKYITQDDTPYIIAIVRDISQRKKENEILKGVNRLKEKLISQASLSEKMSMITRSVSDIFQVDCAKIWLIRDGDLCDKGCLHSGPDEGSHLCRYKDKCLHLVASSGDSSCSAAQTHKRIPFGSCQIGKIAAGECQKFLTNDAGSDQRLEDKKCEELTGGSFAGYRILSQGKVAGVFAVFSSDSLTPSLDATLEDIANTIGQVLTAALSEQQIVNQNKLMANLIDSLSYPFYVINVNDYSIALANAAAKVEVDKAVKCFELSHNRQSPCDGSEHECPLEIVKKTRKPMMTEHVHYDKAGNRQYVEVHCYPVFDSNGDLMQAIEYTIDITDRRMSEDEISRAAEDWDRTFDSITDMIFIQDKERVIVRCNKAFADYMGMDQKDIEGKKCYELLHKDDHAWVGCPYELTLLDGKLHTAEVIDPKIMLPLLVTTSPLFDHEGNVSGAVHVAKNISREKEIEKDISRKMNDLEIFRKSAVGREMKMIDMKKRIQDLEARIDRLQRE